MSHVPDADDPDAAGKRPSSAPEVSIHDVWFGTLSCEFRRLEGSS